MLMTSKTDIQIPFDDIVTINYKRFGYVSMSTTFIWMVGLSIGILFSIYPQRMRAFRMVDTVWSVVTMGTLWGVIGETFVLKALLSNSSIIMDDRLSLMRQEGMHISPDHIALSSFPLLRQLLCIIIVSCLFLLLLIISEVRFFFIFLFSFLFFSLEAYK